MARHGDRMAKAKTGRIVLAVAGSLACHLLAFIALRSERPIILPRPAPAIEVTLTRESETASPAPDKKPPRNETAAKPTHSPQAAPTVKVEANTPPGQVEASAGPAAPTAPALTPVAPPPAKLVFDCDELTPKAASARPRCASGRWARAGSKPGQSQVAFAHQSEFDAEKAQKNGGPIVIGHLTLRPAPDANSDPNLIGVFKFSF